MYLNNQMPLRDQVGERIYMRKFDKTPHDDASSFINVEKYQTLFSCDKTQLESAGMELPARASELPGYFKRGKMKMIE